MLKEKTTHFLLLLMMIALPLSKAVASLALIALVGISLLPPYKFSKNCIQKNSPVCLLIIVFLSLLISQVYTENSTSGWSLVYLYNSFVLLPLVILLNKQIVIKKSIQLLQVFIIATVFNCICTLIFYFLPDETVQQITAQIGILKPYMPKGKNLSFGLYSPFIERIQLGNLIAMATLSAIYLVMQRHQKWTNILLSVFLLGCSLTIGGRAGQLGLFVAILGLLVLRSTQFIFPKLKNKFGIFTASVCTISGFLMLLIAPYLLYKKFPPIQKRYGQMRWELNEYYKGVDRDYSHCTSVRRLISWENSWKVIQTAPVLGVGVGDYRDKMQEQYDKAPIKLSVNLHNQYLFFWACSGIIGLFAFLFVMGNWLLYLNKLGDLRFIFGVAFLLCYGFVFCTDAVLNFQVDNMLFCCFFALIPCLKKEV